MSIKINLEIGHRAVIRSKPTIEGYTHDWELYVKGCDNTDIHYFVDKIIFHLDKTFRNPKRVIKEPPYRIRESGFASFMLPIEVYLRNNEDPKKLHFSYDLRLQTIGPVVNVRKEQYVFHNPTDEFRRKLIKGGGIDISSGSSDNTRDISSEKSSKMKSSSSDFSKKHKKEIKASKTFIETITNDTKTLIKITDPSLHIKEKSANSKKSENKHSSKEKRDKNQEEKKEKKNKDKKDKERKNKSSKRDKSPKQIHESPIRSPKQRTVSPTTIKLKEDKKEESTKEKSRSDSKKSKHRSKDKKEHSSHKDSSRNSDQKEHKSSSKESKSKDSSNSKNKSSKEDIIKEEKPEKQRSERIEVEEKVEKVEKVGKSEKSKHRHKKKDSSKEKKEKRDEESKEKKSSKSKSVSNDISKITTQSIPEIHVPERSSSNREKSRGLAALQAELHMDSSNSSDSPEEEITPKVQKEPKKKEKKSSDSSEKKRKRRKSNENFTPKEEPQHSIKIEDPPMKMLKLETSLTEKNYLKEDLSEEELPEMPVNYMNMLRDLQHKIMTLQDNNELQQIVQLIAETGQFEITSKTFDFDLCTLDRDTVQKLQEFFAIS